MTEYHAASSSLQPIDIGRARMAISLRESKETLTTFDAKIRALTARNKNPISIIYIQDHHLILFISHGWIADYIFATGRSVEAARILARICTETSIYCTIDPMTTDVVSPHFSGPYHAIEDLKTYDIPGHGIIYETPGLEDVYVFTRNAEGQAQPLLKILHGASICVDVTANITKHLLETAVAYLNLPEIVSRIRSNNNYWHPSRDWKEFSALIQGKPGTFRPWYHNAEMIAPCDRKTAYWKLPGNVIVLGEIHDSDQASPCMLIANHRKVRAPFPTMKDFLDKADPDGIKNGMGSLLFTTPFHGLRHPVMNPRTAIFVGGRWTELANVDDAVVETFSIHPYDYTIKTFVNPDTGNGGSYCSKTAVIAALVASPTEPGFEPWSVLIALPADTDGHKYGDHLYIDAEHPGRTGIHAEAIARLFNSVGVRRTNIKFIVDSANCNPDWQTTLPVSSAIVRLIRHDGHKWVPLVGTDATGIAPLCNRKGMARTDAHGLVDWIYSVKPTRKRNLATVNVFVNTRDSIISLISSMTEADLSVLAIPGLNLSDFGYDLVGTRLVAILPSPLDGMTLAGSNGSRLRIARWAGYDLTRTGSQFTWFLYRQDAENNTEDTLAVFGADIDGLISFSNNVSSLPFLSSTRSDAFDLEQYAALLEDTKTAILAATRKTTFRPSDATIRKLEIKESDLPDKDADNVLAIPGTSLSWDIKPERCTLFDGLTRVTTLDRVNKRLSDIPADRLADLTLAYQALQAANLA